MTFFHGNCSFFERILLTHYTPVAYWFTRAVYASSFTWKGILSTMYKMLHIYWTKKVNTTAWGITRITRKKLLNWDFQIVLHIIHARNLLFAIKVIRMAGACIWDSFYLEMIAGNITDIKQSKYHVCYLVYSLKIVFDIIRIISIHTI